MASLYLDTHAAAWMAAGEHDRFPLRARRALRAADLVLSPMVVLELEYLYESGRLQHSGRAVADHLAGTLLVRTCDAPFAQVTEAARTLKWTRDPFDRLIVAQAALSQAPLLTKDRQILDHYPAAFWD